MTGGATHRTALAAVLLLALVSFLLWLVGDGTRDGYRFDLATAGPTEVVFDWSRDACSHTDIPDSPARAFRDAQGRVQLIASYQRTRRMTGPDLDHLVRDCTVVLASHRDPDPARFDDREWISSLYTLDGATVYALLHSEYQGHRHPGRCPSGEYRKCWYNAITLAVSSDGGRSYTHASPPDHLVASIPYRYEPGAGPMGVFSPTNILRHPRDGYFYALFRTAPFRDQPGGISVMRTKHLADPDGWMAWDGRRFAVRFIDPYRERRGADGAHVARGVHRRRGFEVATSVTYNTHLRRYLLIGMSRQPDPTTGESVPGVYYSLSDDLVGWTPVRLLFEAEMPWTYERGDSDPILYPSALDAGSPSRSFETTDRRFYVYFTRFNRGGSGRELYDRDLVRVPVELVERR